MKPAFTLKTTKNGILDLIAESHRTEYQHSEGRNGMSMSSTQVQEMLDANLEAKVMRQNSEISALRAELANVRKDLDAMAVRAFDLRARLTEAVEWDWRTDVDGIPETVWTLCHAPLDTPNPLATEILARDAEQRQEVYERCAKVCETEAAKWEGDGVPDPMSRICAAAIRVLKAALGAGKVKP